ncbi:MAG: formyltetrahydrofolate deformylase [Melioribacteraceae bacterium]|nr:formyltetrahydrofolate deformylase [Melioribacteraceae bacterium]MCF8412083.1 formyltetrahydrofolate deformylase [Melioribacteraceae bacterium]
MKNKAVLLLSCPDHSGLVAKISNFIHHIGGNITGLDEHVDINENVFFLRVAWDNIAGEISRNELIRLFTPLANSMDARWEIKLLSDKMRAAVYVSKFDHCIQELLWRYSNDELNIEIPLVISNHEMMRQLCENYQIPYYYKPRTAGNKIAEEQSELELLSDHKIDFIILARYMQVLTQRFVETYKERIINIHHSFLPAFMGGDPYKQAFSRGVKIIGATSHFVTEILDDGPIIEQDVIRISHRDSVRDLKRKGRDLERSVLLKAIQLYSEHRILLHNKKTIIFE